MIDLTQIGGGSAFIGAAFYAAFSYFASGPLIGDRTIQKSDWALTCQQALQDEVKLRTPPPAFVPRLDCNGLLGLFGAEGHEVCRRHGNPSLPFLDQFLEQKRRLDDFQKQRLEAAIASTTSRCDCARAHMLETKASAWALYAGSARLVTPPAIKNLKSSLMTSLNAPLCQGIGGAS
jgi:hypothetical protein